MRGVPLGLFSSILFLFSFLTPPAEGKYLTLLTDTRPAYDGSRLKLSITVTNRGDEPANQVVASADFGGRTVSGPLQETLGVGETYSATLTLDVGLEHEGQYAAVVRVDYADANHYPFSAISLAHFVHGAVRPSQVFGALQNIELSEKGKLTLKVKTLDEKKRIASIRLILPKEISVRNPVATAPLEAGSVEEVRFGLKNFSALPGSSYPVYALIEYNEEGVHHTTPVSAIVRIVEDPGFVKSNRGFLVSLAIVLSAGFFYLNLRSFRKRKK